MNMYANRVEIFVISKEGAVLHKFNLLEMEETDKDQLVGGFLTALSNFAKDIGFPDGVSLIRSGNLEARYSIGEYAFSVLIIDYSMPLGLSTESLISGLAKDIIQTFETMFHDELIRGQINHVYRSEDFLPFREQIALLIDKYGAETDELYQKLILIESLYAKVPQKWIFPLIERVSAGDYVLNDLHNIPSQYHPSIKRAIEKVHYDSAPVWNLFAIPLFSID